MKTKDPRALLETIPNEVRQTYSNVRALQTLVQEQKASLLVRIQSSQSSPCNDPFRVSNQIPIMFALVRDMGFEYANAKAVMELAENAEAFKAAEAAIDPLLAEIAELDRAEEKRRQEEARIKAELNEERAAAKKTALAEVENHPAVVAVKRKLQAFAAKF
jgi:hypothetical protein